MKVEVYFQVQADDPDLVQHILEMLTAGAKKQWGKTVVVGTPKLPPHKDAVVIAPLNIQTVPTCSMCGAEPGQPHKGCILR